MSCKSCALNSCQHTWLGKSTLGVSLSLTPLSHGRTGRSALPSHGRHANTLKLLPKDGPPGKRTWELSYRAVVKLIHFWTQVLRRTAGLTDQRVCLTELLKANSRGHRQFTRALRSPRSRGWHAEPLLSNELATCSFHRAAILWTYQDSGHLVPRCLALFLFSRKTKTTRRKPL